jgi:hypothetical protein
MKPPKANLYLQAAILEVVENQLRENDPPETKRTYERLLGEGHSSEEAKRLIGCVVVGEMFDILKRQEPFNHARFVAALDKLPELPD